MLALRRITPHLLRLAVGSIGVVAAVASCSSSSSGQTTVSDSAVETTAMSPSTTRSDRTSPAPARPTTTTADANEPGVVYSTDISALDGTPSVRAGERYATTGTAGPRAHPAARRQRRPTSCTRDRRDRCPLTPAGRPGPMGRALLITSGSEEGTPAVSTLVRLSKSPGSMRGSGMGTVDALVVTLVGAGAAVAGSTVAWLTLRSGSRQARAADFFQVHVEFMAAAAEVV